MCDECYDGDDGEGSIGYVFHDAAAGTIEMYRDRDYAESLADGGAVVAVNFHRYVSWLPMAGTCFRPGDERYTELAMLLASTAMARRGVFKD